MPPADPLVGQLVGERYRLQRRIGSGGMSLVYLADVLAGDDVKADRLREKPLEGKPLVAVKFLRSAFASLPDFVSRFEQEARACRLLDHRNCLHVLDHGVAFGSPYLVMEYVSGTSLADVLAEEGALPNKRALHITRQILAGLSHAHAQGVVHRDLKPRNIMLAASSDGIEVVKMLDFGTAQLLANEPAGQASEVGTPWYMAPEQVAGQPTGPCTDLYALGVILFEMLTGTRPYVAEDPMRVLQMHLTSPIPSARALKPEAGISPELEAVIRKAMQKAPADRYASAGEFAEALAKTPELQRQGQGRRRCAVPQPATAAEDPTPEPGRLEPLERPWAQRYSRALALGLAGGLLLVLLLLAVLRAC